MRTQPQNRILLKADILPSKLIIHDQTYSNSAPKQACFYWWDIVQVTKLIRVLLHQKEKIGDGNH